MNIKQMLMASTAVLALGGAALPASAQTTQPQMRVAQEAPPALIGAIQTYREAEAMRAEAEASGGDVAAADAALDSARTELAELCAAVGQSDIEACIALFEGNGAAAPEPDEEVAPEVIEEEADVEPEAEAEVPAEPEPTPEPAPEPEPEPAPEAPVEEPSPEPAPEQPAAEPTVEPAPEISQEEPAAEETPVEEPVVEPQPAPEPEPEPAAQEEEQTQPEVEAEADVEVDADLQSSEQDSGAPQSLLAAVQAYRDADSAEARSAAETEILAICEAIGQPDLMACLAAFNIELEMVAPEDDAEAPVDADADAEAGAEVEGEEVTPPPAEEPQPEPELQDEIVLEDGDQGEIVPEGVNAEEVAPLLDSEKDAAAAQARGETEADVDAEMEASSDVEADAEAEAQIDADAEAEAQAEVEAPAEPVAVPTSDAEAQAQLTREDVISILNEEGQRRAQEESQEPELIGRVERETPSNLEIITTIGLATVFAIGANQFIDAPDTPRIIDDNYQDYYVEDLPRGRTRETVIRADGSQLVTVRDRYGSVIRRSRIEPDGREILLVYVDEDTRRYDDQGRWIDPARDLPPLRLNIPAREYVLDASYADQQQVETFLDQPPVETIQRYYTIDEVKRSSRVRDMVRRLEVGGLTFDTGSANIPQQELSALSAVANAMLDLLEQNPAETFLIEGHTDAIGSDLSNLELSNLRAESVAYALTRVYGIPPENLATQGYGERYLKINTQRAERLNRRVTIRRITPLITPVASAG